VHLEYNSRAGSRRPLLSWCGAPLPDGAVWAALIVSCPSAHALEGVSEDACPFLSWFYLFASLVDDGAGGWCSSSSRCWWSAATQSDNCRADFWCSDRVANWSIMIPLGLSACFFWRRVSLGSWTSLPGLLPVAVVVYIEQLQSKP